MTEEGGRRSKRDDRASLFDELTLFVARYPDRYASETTWGEPLAGVASASDPLFAELRTLVGPTHALPGELLDGARSVIAYFLPFDRAVPRSNRDTRLASEIWARAYVETNQLIIDLNQHLAALLEKRGERAALPPPTHNFDTRTLRSDWSHKHVAFIAGLGRFGVHHQLITAHGCGGRLGSMVTSLELEPTPRDESERCLKRAGFECLACVRRCPIDALGADSLDKQACYALLLENETEHARLGKADVCGKCGSRVPCVASDPVAARARRALRRELSQKP